MKILLFFLTLPLIIYAQDGDQIKEHVFTDSCILYLPFVDPGACDYPYNLAFFYSFDEYKKLKFSGVVNQDRLLATRTWIEEDYEGDSIIYEEEIYIQFGDSESYRNITNASYSCRQRFVLKAEEWDDDQEICNPSWPYQSAKIDYDKNELTYSYQRNFESPAMYLTIQNPAVEEISFLQNLCFFYRAENQTGTEFSMNEE